MGAAEADAERARLDAVGGTDPALLYALAARAFADKLHRIETLNVTPDLAAAISGALRPRTPPA